MSSSVDDAPTSSLLRIANVGRIFAEPARVYDEEAAHPNALVPFAVYLALMAAIVLLMSRPMATLLLNGIPEAMRAEAGPQLQAMIETNRWITLLYSPFMHGGRILLLAGFLYSAALFLGVEETTGDGAFHRALSLAIYASFALVVEELANVAALQVVGLDRIQGFWDLKPVIGLHFLVGEPETHRAAFAALQRINPFTLLYAFLLALGFRRIFHASWPAAWAVAVGANLAGILVITLMVALQG